MEEADLLRRVSDLEEQVKSLRASVKPAAERAGFVGRCQTFARLLIANWVLLSFLSVCLIAVYAKFAFDIDFFEKYRNDSATKKLSEFYGQMGDRMMGITEWEAAKEAYGEALKINPDNTAATFGLAKARVFDPLPGNDWAPDVVDARLNYLLSRFPDDYQIYFLKGVRYHSMEKDAEAAVWLRKSIDKNPKFLGGYLQLAFVQWAQSDLTDAETNLAKAVELDPDSATAKNNLAACHMVLSDFSGAVPLFEESYRISPSAVTALSLNEAYWYSLNFDRALAVLQPAADYMDQKHDLPDHYIGGEMGSGFLPLVVGDRETIKTTVPIYTVDQKRPIFHFELAIDHALLGEIAEANKEFDFALKLRPSIDIRRLIQNRMESVGNIVRPLPEATRTWLTEHRDMLD
jgi:tetratricopeptide (TPR) repeat protein